MSDETEGVEEDEGVSSPPSASWLKKIADAEQVFEEYQSKADSIDQLYANLGRLANDTRDRQFQLFWANIQVVAPSIYSRPPVPVVVPRFRERKALPRTASELLERAAIVAFEQEDMDGTMRLIRDDLCIVARGVPWLRYEKKEDGKPERVCIEHKDRKDFLHEPARKWSEVGWVAVRAWLSKDQMEDRFKGNAWKDAAFEVRKDDKELGGSDQTLKAGVWEIWVKDENRVVWVTEGVETLLDEGPAHLTLDGFYPCPRPAYSTVQRRSLVPVPDMVFYKDQLEEINELTARISALADAVKVRAFYPAGAGEIGDAIEAAIKSNANNQVMVPISNWAAFGNGSAKDVIIWLPIDMIVATIAQLVELRKQLIDDVYQITGLSDIMRGSTKPNETLGAQELKSQYGSIRIRDRQDELIRVARDVTRIAAEIMAENFSAKTLLDMSQMDLPTDADISKQIKALEMQAAELQREVQQQIAQAQSNPQIMAHAQANPEEAQKMLDGLKQQAQEQLSQMGEQAQKLQETVTIDQVMRLLREQKLRPFVLDIETDSTIAPDENAQKQRATEFITAVGGFLNQAIAAVQAVPQVAPLMADTLKYVAGQFRAGRQLDTTIDEFAEQMKAMGQQAKPNPEADAMAAQTQIEQQKFEADMQAKAADQELKQKAAADDAKLKQDQAAAKFLLDKAESEERMKGIFIDLETKAEARANAQAKHQQDMEKGVLEIELLKTKINQSEIQTDNAIKTTEASISATAEKTAIQANAVKARETA